MLGVGDGVGPFACGWGAAGGPVVRDGGGVGDERIAAVPTPAPAPAGVGAGAGPGLASLLVAVAPRWPVGATGNEPWFDDASGELVRVWLSVNVRGGAWVAPGDARGDAAGAFPAEEERVRNTVPFGVPGAEGTAAAAAAGPKYAGRRGECAYGRAVAPEGPTCLNVDWDGRGRGGRGRCTQLRSMWMWMWKWKWMVAVRAVVPGLERP
jgi:hypothetical protein